MGFTEFQPAFFETSALRARRVRVVSFLAFTTPWHAMRVRMWITVFLLCPMARRSGTEPGLPCCSILPMDFEIMRDRIIMHLKSRVMHYSPKSVVEISNDAAFARPRFVDSASPAHIALAFAAMLIFICLHIVAAARTPKFVSFSEDYFPIAAPIQNSSADLDLTLSELHNLHRFLDVQCALVRRSSAASAAHTATIAARTLFSNNFTVVNSYNSHKKTLAVDFPIGVNRSSSFTILHLEVLDYDTAQIKIMITTDFEAIEGLSFRWAWADRSGIGHGRVARMVLSAFHGYMLCIFLQSLVKDFGTLTDAGCLAVAIAGILSCNPPWLLIGTRRTARFADHFLIATYAAVLRIFCMAELEQLRSQKVTPPWVLLGFATAFFGGCALVDTAAKLERAQFLCDSDAEVRTVLPGERAAVPGSERLCHCESRQSQHCCFRQR
jgi:hypothetical protein